MAIYTTGNGGRPGRESFDTLVGRGVNPKVAEALTRAYVAADGGNVPDGRLGFTAFTLDPESPNETPVGYPVTHGSMPVNGRSPDATEFDRVVAARAVQGQLPGYFPEI